MKKSIILAGLLLTGALLLSTSVSAQENKKHVVVSCDKQENVSCDKQENVSCDKQENVSCDKQENVSCDKQENVSCEVSKDVKTASFKVYGSCGMCKDRIEKAATSVDGVCSSEWDNETKMMKFTYHPEKVKVEKIHDAVALVGHDTEKATASDKVYASLPACCKYDRR